MDYPVECCKTHGKPCFVKTGVKEGPNFGKTFYICGVSSDSCGYSRPVDLKPVTCPVHGQMVELRYVRLRSSGEPRLEYRCTDGRQKDMWCSRLSGPSSSAAAGSSALLQVAKDGNAPASRVSSSGVGEDADARRHRGTEAAGVSKLPLGADRSIRPTDATSEEPRFRDPTCVERAQLPSKSAATDAVGGAEMRLSRASEKNSPRDQNFTARSADVVAQPRATHKPATTDASSSVVPEMKDLGYRTHADDRSSDSASHLPLRASNAEKVRRTPKDSTEQSSTARTSLGSETEIGKQKQIQAGADDIGLSFERLAISEQSAHGRPATVQVYEGGSRTRAQLEADITKKQQLLRTTNVQNLPDGGKRIREQLARLEEELSRLPPVPIDDCLSLRCDDTSGAKSKPSAAEMASSAGSGLSSTFDEPRSIGARPAGISLMSSAPIPEHVLREMYRDNRGYRGSGSALGAASPSTKVTAEAIDRLHRQLESCPKPSVEAAEPEGLTVPLLIHQRQALAWLAWRERQLPPGGILADDMGLGKTLTMIAHILAGKLLKLSTPADDEDDAVLNSDKRMHPTLVVCPASLIHQWEAEIKRRCSPDALTVQLFHGAKRERRSSRLAAADIVLTTYNIVVKEYATETQALAESSDSSLSPKHSGDVKKHGDQSQRSPLFLIHWERVVLDEAHNIKNHNSQSALAVCSLTARARWAVTGTPVQNNYTDFYSLLRFLQCKPFDDAKVWKKWVDNESRDGIERLGILSRSLLLRRTKQDTDSTGKPLVVLPKKTNMCHKIELLAEERKLYDIIHSRAQSAFIEYMQTASTPGSVVESRQGARRSAESVESDRIPLRQHPPLPPPTRGSLLLLLLRLRQCCCHVALTKEPLPDDEAHEESICADDLSLAMAQLQLDGSAPGDASSPTSGSTSTSVSASSCSSGSVSGAGERSQNGQAGSGSTKDATAYDSCSPSSKVAFLMARLKEIKETSKDTVSKSVVVSQWTSMLDIVAQQLEAAGYRYYTIRGDVEPKRRSEIVEDFNGNKKSPEVMLVSLRAGGVGLNLVGANHLFLIDPHWNPALEDQACDRIYRLGQVKEVYIHKFLSKDTIEEKITDLQCRKKAMADSALGSNKETAKSGLSLDDLKMLFRVS